MAADGAIILGGEEYTVDTIRPALVAEKTVLSADGKGPKDANIIIRAHKDAATGNVQELISTCQEVDFENFMLRAKELVL